MQIEELERAIALSVSKPKKYIQIGITSLPPPSPPKFEKIIRSSIDTHPAHSLGRSGKRFL